MEKLIQSRTTLDDGSVQYSLPWGKIKVSSNGDGFMQRILDRLWEYEQAEEQGRLVTLPSKPHYKLYSGEEIYIVDDGKVYMDYIAEIILGESVRDRSKIDALYITGDGYSFVSGAWGKTVFLTHEEANVALKGE